MNIPLRPNGNYCHGGCGQILGVARREKVRREGVSACATCDGFFYRKKKVAVVGGGDTACEEALYLAGLAEKVYMIVRKPICVLHESCRNG